nr:hypothetical protein Iba_chr07dCG4670 [Ipomoea batatas]
MRWVRKAAVAGWEGKEGKRKGRVVEGSGKWEAPGGRRWQLSGRSGRKRELYFGEVEKPVPMQMPAVPVWPIIRVRAAREERNGMEINLRRKTSAVLTVLLLLFEAIQCAATAGK